MRNTALDEMVAMVTEFHKIFGHPIATSLESLHLKRRLTRARWIHRELVEYLTEVKYVPRTKELADMAYFSVGNLVEIGLPGELTKESIGNCVVEPDLNAYTQNTAHMEEKLAAFVWENLSAFLTSEHLPIKQGLHSARLALATCDWIEKTTLADPVEIFRAVHESNLTKVWPDGTIRYAPDGKILKPPSFVQPITQIATILKRALRNQPGEDEDDLPF